MPFIAPFIVAGLGLTGAAAFAATAVIQIGTSLALSYAAQKLLAPKAKDAAVPSETGTQLTLEMDPSVSRKIPVGTCGLAGSLVYWQHYGANNIMLDMVIALGDWPCDSLVGMYVDGKPVTLNVDGTVGGEYAGYMSTRFHNGAWDQTADTDLIANSGGDWTSAHRGAGVCYVVVTLKYSAEVFKGGVPRMLFVVKGAKLYDYTKDSTVGGSGLHRWNNQSTWEWTDDPAIIHYNVRRGLYVGNSLTYFMSTPSASLPVTDFATATGVCRQTLTLEGGGTEKRYTCNGIIDTASSNKTILTDVMTCYHGAEAEIGGLYRPLAGAARTSVKTLTERDIDADSEFMYAPLGTDNPVNAVFGSYIQPSSAYQSIALPPRISLDDEVLDGQRFEASYTYNMVTSETQAQRLMEISRRLARLRGSLKAVLTPRAMRVEVGDWITLDMPTRGWANKTYIISQLEAVTGDKIEATFQEISSTAYNFSAATDLLESGAQYVVRDSTPATAEITGLTVANVTIASDSSSYTRPGLQITWDAITDPTVVAIELNYRVKSVGGDGLFKRIDVVTVNNYTWVDGIQGETVYEVRVRPIVLPERTRTWTNWIFPAAATGVQVIPSSIGAASIAPDTVTPAMLSPQARFELSLVTAIGDVQGSVAESFNRAYEAAQRAGQEAIRVLGYSSGLAAQVRTEIITRMSETEALAQLLTTVQTTLNGQSSSITELLESTNGLSSSWTIAVDSNNKVMGFVRLNGTNAQSTFDVLADVFRISLPGTTGGDSVQVFTIANVGGTPKIVLRGDMLSDGLITAAKLNVGSLSTITTDAGEITAGIIRSSDNKVIWNLNTKIFTWDT